MEPLAIVIPPSLGHSGNAEAKGSGRKPSNWVQRKEKGVGKLLGASYSGYEQVVTKLLMDIEARHLQRKAGMIGPQRLSSSGRKCSRELKGLVSSINYEAKNFRGGKRQGQDTRGHVVYQ